MAQTSILSSISRTGTFPIRKTINAPNNCGTISLVLNQNWTEQMIHELPTINVAVYIDTDIKLLSIDIDMSTVTSDNIELKPVTPYSIPLFDLPTDFDFVVTPIFDEDALLSHNLQIDSGDIDVFNTSDNGIVDTNISSYINEYWTTKTDTFNLNMVFDNSNIASGGSGGGGGGGQITVDTQVMQGSTNPVQNGAIYDFVNSSVSTNTAYFIGTFNSLSDLENYSGEVSNNDYAFVVSVDSNSNTVYNRYKYNSETETWNFEYSLNNSSFTAAEWETIQSGLTANDRTNYNNHLTNTNNPHSVTKAQVGLGNVDNTSDADKPVSTAMQTALDAKQNTLTFDGTYNASTNKAATVSTVTNAINDLDVSSVGGSGKYISAISETDGKISPIVETMDTVPTNGSTKAVTSGGVQAPLAEVVDAGAKNLLKFVSLSQSYRNGVDFTLNSDGSVTVNGTPSGTAPSYVSLMIAPTTAYDAAEFCDGKHIISGCPSGGGASSYRIQVAKSNYAVYDYGSGAVLSSTTLTGVNIIIYIPNGVTVDNLVFRPMICTKAAWDVSHTYEPYAKTNRELTVAEDEDRAALIEQVDGGAKNLLKIVTTSQSYDDGNITFTVNTDQTVTVNATNNHRQQSLVLAYLGQEFYGKTVVISGCPVGGNFSTGYYLLIYKASGSTTIAYDIGDSVTLTIPNENCRIAIGIRANAVVNNLVFKPMICTTADYAVTTKFVPYAPTNRELYESDKVIDISNAITAETGYTVESSTHLYYQNKQVFGTIAIAINSGSYPSSLTAIAKLPAEYAPARQYLGSCGFSTDQWAITNIGYAFIQGANASSTAQRGQISVKSPTANLTHMILNVCYPVQIDGTL